MANIVVQEIAMPPTYCEVGKEVYWLTQLNNYGNDALIYFEVKTYPDTEIKEAVMTLYKSGYGSLYYEKYFTRCYLPIH